jgi:hypothetical protein
LLQLHHLCFYPQLVGIFVTHYFLSRPHLNELCYYGSVKIMYTSKSYEVSVLNLYLRARLLSHLLLQRQVVADRNLSL